jgi:predicted transcriptional regulator
MPDPGAELIRLVNDYATSQALYVAATLRLSDLLAGGAKSVDELAAATDSDAGTLYELMHGLANAGVFEEKPGRTFSGTRLSELLRSDRPVSFTSWARFVGRPCDEEAWAQLLQNVRRTRRATR